jgi:hypothetical protein
VLPGIKTFASKGLQPKENVVLTYPLSKDTPPPKLDFGRRTSVTRAFTRSTSLLAESPAGVIPLVTPGDAGDTPEQEGPTGAEHEVVETPVGDVGRLRGDLLVLVVGQARQMGRMVNICPDALVDDGLLDVAAMFGSMTDQVRVHTCGGRVRKYGALQV